MKKKKVNIKLVIVLILVFTFGIITSGITISYAATALSSNNVHYDNTNSGGSSSTVSGALDELYAVASDHDLLKAEIVDIIYPVGSVYISTTDSTVAMVQEKFGGTWVRYGEDKTIVGYKSGTNTVNATGGSKTVTLSTSNLPSHSHSITPSGTVTSTFTGKEISTNSTGSHSHTISHTHTTPATAVNNWSAASAGAHTHTVSGTAASSGTHHHSVLLFTSGQNTMYGVNVAAAGAHHNYINTHPSHFTYSAGVANRYQSYFGESTDTGAHTHTVSGTAASAGAHTHTVSGTIPAMTTNSQSTTTSGSNGSHSHTVTAAGTVSSTFKGTSADTSKTGSGTSFSVQNPYIVVYMYKRTA